MSAISQLLAAMDDSSWEALGSKGLLRRATKELEKGAVCEIAEDSPLVFAANVSGVTVTVPIEGPAKAKCTCGTQGCCHHLITVGLFLRKAAQLVDEGGDEHRAAEPQADLAVDRTGATDGLLRLEYSIVKRWCGVPAWRSALRLLDSGVSAGMSEEGPSLLVFLNPLGVTCRFLAGTGLDGAIVTGGDTKTGKALVTAAVIALKTKHGQTLPPEESTEAVLKEEKGAPRTRAEVLVTAKSLLELSVDAGLSHASASSAERFATLAVSADGTNLPRLARALKTVADELGMIATRHGRADAERTLEAMANVYALVAALMKGGTAPAGHLVGQHRTGYVEIRSLDLIGTTAFPWQTRSGFRGITVLFWDVGEKRWASWSEARCVSIDPRFNPLAAFDNSCPWADELTIRTLAVSRVHLVNAKRNTFGRLSSSTTCKATLMGPASLNEPDFGARVFLSWKDLADYITSTSATGLKLADPMSDWVLLSPAQWGERQFDRVEQRLTWQVLDAEGRQLHLVLMYSDMTRHGVEQLEQWEPPVRGGVRILGRFLRATGEFAVEPVALFPEVGSAAKPVHLLISPPAPNTGRTPVKPTVLLSPADNEKELEEDDTDESRSWATDRWLRMARSHLVAQAETGCTGKRPVDTLQSEALVQKLADIGLPVLSAGLKRAASPDDEQAANVLRASFLVRLHEQCKSFW